MITDNLTADPVLSLETLLSEVDNAAYLCGAFVEPDEGDYKGYAPLLERANDARAAIVAHVRSLETKLKEAERDALRVNPRKGYPDEGPVLPNTEEVWAALRREVKP